MSASTQDFLKTLDLSGQASISGSDIGQVTDTATPAADKGLLVLTTDTAGTPDIPNAATTTKWKRYIWLRQGAAMLTAYVWNDAAVSGVLLKWESIASASVTDGSITNAKLAALAVTGDKITNGTITSDKIAAGVIPSSLPPSGAAGGSLDGTYPNPTIANGAVTTTMIANDSVTTSKIDEENITLALLALDGSNARRVARTSVNGSAWEYVDLYLQRVTSSSAAWDNTNDVIPTTDDLPLVTDGKDAVTALVITPQKIGSKILIRANASLFVNGVLGVVLALFKDDVCVASSIGLCDTYHVNLTVSYEFLSASLTPVTFKLRFAPGATGTVYINGSNVSRILGGALRSVLEIVEVPA